MFNVHVTRCLVVLFTFILINEANKKNVCKSFEDYYTINENHRCWYNFAAELSVPELIQHSGYPVTEHKVQTADGYILTMFRIPGKGNPIFLMHGLQTTCVHYLSIGNDSLAFVLAREGYDVWLGNMRGNKYSEEHTNLTIHDKKYWDYSMDEIALYDIPAQLNHIISSTTGQKGNIVYIGHSLGATVGLIYTSLLPEESQGILKHSIYMAPAGMLSNAITPIKYIAPFIDTISDVVDTFDLIRFVSQTQTVNGWAKQMCLESPRQMQFCTEILALLYGPSSKLRPELVPVFFNENPSGGSLKMVNHAKELFANNFRKYDYGLENVNIYGSASPPDYDMSKIVVPCYFIYTVADWMVSAKDVLNLYQTIPRAARLGIYEINDPDINHVNLVFGENVKTVVYNHLLDVLNKYKYFLRVVVK